MANEEPKGTEQNTAESGEVLDKKAKKEQLREQRRKDQKSAAKAVKSMKEYTYRDLGQELIMRRKMWRAITLFIMTLIALVVFIALFISERQRIQQTYAEKYNRSMETFLYDMDDYLNAEADFELRYRMIVSDAANMSAFAFLREDFEEEQKSVNALYTAILKYPEQMGERMSEIREIVDGIRNYEKGAYDKLNEFIDSINLKGY